MLTGLSRRALTCVLAATAALLPMLATASPAAADPPAACPATGIVSQHFHSGHNGVDIANSRGTPIYAIGDGQVTISGYESGYGQWIRIQHPNGTISEYGHMYQRDVFAGDHVVAGQRIALMGSEGQSTGPHLHLRIWSSPSANQGIDPEPYLAARGVTLPCTPGVGPRPTPPVHPAESGRVVSARSADGRLEVFAAGANGVHHAWQNKANGTWSAWQSLGGPGNAELAIGPNADGRLELFAINGDTFQHRYQNSPSGTWSGWENFGGGGKDIAVGSNKDGRLEVFASGPVGVFHKYQNASGWSEWEATGGPGNSQLTSERSPDGRVEVFAINGNTAQHLWQTRVNAPYGQWETFGTGGTEITAATNADGRIEVFGASHAGVYHKWQTGFATWSDWAWVNTTSGPALD